MEHAARAALSVLEESFDTSLALFLCGSGNNGGDGLACARILAKEGITTRVFLVGSRESMTADSRANEARLAEAEVKLCKLNPPLGGQVTKVCVKL